MEMAGYSLTEVMLPTQKDQKQCTRSENRRFMFVAAVSSKFFLILSFVKSWIIYLQLWNW